MCLNFFFFKKWSLKCYLIKKIQIFFSWSEFTFSLKIIIIMYIIERTLWIKFASCWGWIVYLCAFGCEYFFCVQYGISLSTWISKLLADSLLRHRRCIVTWCSSPSWLSEALGTLFLLVVCLKFALGWRERERWRFFETGGGESRSSPVFLGWHRMWRLSQKNLLDPRKIRARRRNSAMG